jgi:hypothetical protein
MSNMKNFFQYLADRLDSENDLSDITWALCKSDKTFKKTFLDFCFGGEINKIDDYEIEREFTQDNTRLDFFIYKDRDNNKEKKYLLEVKKYDQNIHDNYKTEHADKTRAIIANYNVSDTNGVFHHNKTWHDLIKEIERKIKDDDELNKPIIYGYIDYLKSVTNYFQGETMNLSNLKSLNIFLKTIRKIIDEYFHNKYVKCKLTADEACMGYTVEYYEKKEYIKFWFGITFDSKEDNNSYIVIEFKKECSPYINKILLKKEGCNYFYKPEPNNEDGSINFYMEENLLKEIINGDLEKDQYEDQEKKLNEFFKEVIKDVFSTLSPSSN